MASETLLFNWTLFKNQMGVFVKNSNLFDTQRTAWDLKKTENDSQFNNSNLERETRDAINIRLDAVKASLLSNQNANKQEASDYITGLLRAILGSSFETEEDVLSDLKTKMTGESQTFKQNIVGFQPAEWSEVNDGSDQVTGYEGIRGLKSTLLDASLILYISVIDEGAGNFHLEGFKATARLSGDKIFTSSTYTGAATVTLSEANSSGISGTLATLIGSPVADSDINVTFSFNSSQEGSGSLDSWSASQLAKEGDDLRIVCESEDTQGSETWVIYSRFKGRLSEEATTSIAYPASDQDDKSGLAFTISEDTTFTKTLDAGGLLDQASFANLTGVKRTHVDASRKIYVKVSFSTPNYTIKGYSDSGYTNQIFESDTYTATGTVNINASNSSGIGGTLDVLVLGSDTTIEVVMALRWREGDTFNISLDSDNAGKFMSFFRDSYEFAPPSASSGAETLADPS